MFLNQCKPAMVVESAIVLVLLVYGGRGAMKRPVMTRPLTKPYSLQGPELPVQGPQPHARPRLVNPEVITTSPRKNYQHP